MTTFATPCLAAVVAVAALAAGGRADEPKAGAKADNKLLGTWRLVSAKYGGEEVKRPEGFEQVKHVTPAQFMWAFYDKDGKVSVALGGTYTLKGEDYVETPVYGTEEILGELKGKPQEFKWKIEGKKWYHNGKLSNGQTIEEVWERVEKK